MNATMHQAGKPPLLLEILLRKGVLNPKKLEQIRTAQAKGNETVEDTLARLGYATDRDIAAAYSEHLVLPLYEPPASGDEIDRTLSRYLSEKLCRDQLLVPVAHDDETLTVAFATPSELLMVDEIQLLTGLRVRPLIAPLSVVEAFIGALYYGSGWPAADIPSGGKTFEQAETIEEDDHLDHGGEGGEEVLHLDQPPPPGRDGRIIRLVNQILEQAFRMGASDIHLEPFEDGCKVRLRIDGALNELAPPPLQLFTAIVSRIKVLAKMDIAEKRLPQDGAIALKSGDKRMDLRVNTVPTVYGEKVVMRVLDRSAIQVQLSSLGLDERQSNDMIQSIEMPHGLMLVTGPTGSGKSTTLYACLNLLNKPDKNICTVEDPVEYKFKGLNQVQVKSQIGFTFASALRSFLRQDPDVIMVGEVRDLETAEICLRAALTGHFVLSSLHTNDALSAISRLVDIGLEPFLLASTLRVLEAQRLLRRLCLHCKQPFSCDAQTANTFGFETGQTLYRAVGCDQCRNTGYRGRVGVFEVIRITSKLCHLIQKRAPVSELAEAAREQGMKLLPDSALCKVGEGITSLEQALSVMVSEE